MSFYFIEFSSGLTISVLFFYQDIIALWFMTTDMNIQYTAHINSLYSIIIRMEFEKDTSTTIIIKIYSI